MRALLLPRASIHPFNKQQLSRGIERVLELLFRARRAGLGNADRIELSCVSVCEHTRMIVCVLGDATTVLDCLLVWLESSSQPVDRSVLPFRPAALCLALVP